MEWACKKLEIKPVVQKQKGRNTAKHFYSDADAEQIRESWVRRQGVHRGRGIRLTTARRAEEGVMSDEQIEFVLAIDDYKRRCGCRFLRWTEVLEVVKALGYRKNG